MYYAFINNGKLDGCGQCRQLTDGVINFEISDNIAEHITDYIWDGENIVINPDLTKIKNEEQRQNREQAYIVEVDPLMSEYNRKKTFNLFDECEETELLQAIQNKVAEIKERYPYATVEG